MIKVLVVDDSALVRKLFGRVLAGEADMEVAFARDGAEALAQVTVFGPDVVTLDIHMPVMDGLACLDRIMVEHPTPVMMVSSLSREGADITLEALQLGAVDFVAKPEGAVSLHMEDFGPQFVAKVRAAAGARLKASARLRERVQHRVASIAPSRTARVAGRLEPLTTRGCGEGIVIVGTSTGGPPALEALLGPLGPGFPWPIVVAQHMPAAFTGPLARRLDRLSGLRIVEVDGRMDLEAGSAYIGRGDGDVIVSRRGGRLVAMPAPLKEHPWHPSVERLVQSAMACFPPSQIVGVLMTGMGRDGAEAMAALHALGGRTIAEAEETAVVWGMPGELVAAGGADWVVPIQNMAAKLQQLMPIHAAGS